LTLLVYVMYIEFKNKKLKRTCEDIQAATRKWGPKIAIKLVQRLNEIDAADCLMT